ncbi:MAG: pyridoxamine 5'-phosphate oxidase family protein [Coriobacteriia bacterium]
MTHHMRRTDREITDPVEVDSILRTGRYCSVALVDGDKPYVVVLSYGYDDAPRRLYFHVAHEGYKIELIRSNPLACVSIVIDGGYQQGECAHNYESVIVRGAMRVVDGSDEQRHALRVLVGHQEDDPETYWASRELDAGKHYKRFTALALDIESVTAKRGS